MLLFAQVRQLYRAGPLALALLLGGCLVAALAAAARGQGEGIGVSAYPEEMQKHYRVFAGKCSRCHALSRPLGATYATEAQWRDVIRRMARLPGAGISPSEQDQIRTFLVFHTEVRTGRRKLEPAVKPEPKPAMGSASGPAPTVVTREGLRVEALAREPQPLLRLHDGQWTEEKPQGNPSIYLVVRLVDEATGEKIPYAAVSARVLSVDAGAQRLAPALGPDGFHYGANLVAPAGRVRIALTIEPPALAQVGSASLKLARPVTVEMALGGS